MGNDPDDLIVQAFKAYDIEGKIDAGMFKHALMTWGDKFSASEVDDIFGEFEIDEDNMIKSNDVIGLFVAQKEEEKKEEEKAPEPEPEAEPEEDAGAAKKKEEEEGRQVKLLSFNAPVITRIPQNHLSPRGGRFSFLVSTKKIHFQKNYRIVPERWINIFCIRMSVFPLPSVWTSGAPLCCTRRRNVL